MEALKTPNSQSNLEKKKKKRKKKRWSWMNQAF